MPIFGTSTASAGNATLEAVSQTAHGFSLLDLVYHNGTTWLKASAALGTSIAQAIVSQVVSVDSFKVTYSGIVTATGHGKVVGEYFYLDQVTAGASTATQPTSGIIQQTFFVKDANTILVDIGNAFAAVDTIPDVDLTYGRVNISTDLAGVVFTNANNGVKIPFNNTKYSSGITFTGTDVMTPSLTGRYRVSWLMQAGSGEFAGNGYFCVMQNGVFIDRVFYDMMEAAGVNQCAGFIDVNLTANLPVELRYQSSITSDTIAWQAGSYFQIDQLPGKIITVVDGNTPTVDQTSLNYFDLGNMRIQWGTHNDANVDTTTVTLPIAFANTNYSVVANSNTGAGSLCTENKTTTTFDIDRASTFTVAQDYSWMAIGSKV